jgi:dissimilatory sulfite reductase related protein
MMQDKIYSGNKVVLSDDGYFTDALIWSQSIAREIAREENIELTDKHLAIIEFLRARYFRGETISIRSIKQSGIIDVKTFYIIFPGAPLKKASRIAGLPKPTSCV